MDMERQINAASQDGDPAGCAVNVQVTSRTDVRHDYCRATTTLQLSVSEGRVVDEVLRHLRLWTVTSPSRRSSGRCTIEEGRKHVQTMIVIPKLPGGWNARGYQGIEGVTCSAWPRR